MDIMQKEVAKRSSAKRKSAAYSHNRKTSVLPINFEVDEFLFRDILQRERGSNPSFRWKGPFRVTECRSECIFTIGDLITGAMQEAHGPRLKFSRNSSFKITEEVLDHLSYQKRAPYCKVVSRYPLSRGDRRNSCPAIIRR